MQIVAGNVIALSDIPVRIKFSDIAQHSILRMAARHRIAIIHYFDQLEAEPIRFLKSRLEGDFCLNSGDRISLLTFRGYYALVSLFKNILKVLQVWTRQQYQNKEPCVQAVKKIFKNPRINQGRSIEINVARAGYRKTFSVIVKFTREGKTKSKCIARFVVDEETNDPARLRNGALASIFRDVK